MEVFAEYLAQIDNENHRTRIKEILNWVNTRFPDLKPKIAWNQPMFTDHDTFIIGFSVSKQHISISPELEGMEHFSDAIAEAGYTHSKLLFRIKWNEEVNYTLLEEIISFNRLDKAHCRTFWRK